ncbi:MAG: ATP-binding protein [Burkholderiaceae bacterium]
MRSTLPRQRLPSTESSRLEALEGLRILDTLPEDTFDDLVVLASQVCGVPIALMSLVASDRQWFKARIGLAAQETHRDFAFCAHAIRTPDEVFVVEDASRDPRFANNPLVTGDPNIRFYAGAPIVTADGQAVGTVCVIDIRAGILSATQRRCLEALASHASLLLRLRQEALDAAQLEEALLARNETLEHDVDLRTQQLDRQWETSEDLLVTVDRDGRLQRVGASWYRLLGYPPDRLLSRPFVELADADDAALANEVLSRARACAGPVASELRIRAADGSWRWIVWTWTAADDGGRLDGVGRDVTEARDRQAALEAAEAALRQSQKMEALGQLTGGLAHDFNNLLTGITGSLELLQRRIAEGRIHDLDRYLITAQSAARRAAALTHRLLAFARRQTLDPKAIDVDQLVAGMEEMIRRTMGPQILCEIVGPSELWPALVDANQLENALLNLCINARDAMPEGGWLTIETANHSLVPTAAHAFDLAAGQYLALSVTDSGTGMSEEIVKRAFDPFFTTKPLGAGTGLGLSMVYGFARQSGGQVRIDSEPGRGTTITLYLPRHFGEIESVHKQREKPLAAHAIHEETVLVIDDEPTVRTLIAEVLDDLGYRCFEAHDGAAGLELLQSNARVDLLITDVGLPGGLNGRQVADAARALRPGLRVLFITGYAENAVVGNGGLDPGMAVLTKPFSLELLSQRIGAMLSPDRP